MLGLGNRPVTSTWLHRELARVPAGSRWRRSLTAKPVTEPVPFIIFITADRPLTVRVTGSSWQRAVILPMAVIATFATSRIVEQNLVALDPGLIEAARALGAGPLRIVWTVVVREALAPLILGYTFLFVAITDMSAMAGAVAGGGLGDFAIQCGH